MNQFTIAGDVVRTQNKVTQSGKQVCNFSIKCKNRAGFDSTINVEMWHDNDPTVTAMQQGDQVTVYGSLRNQKNEFNGVTTWKLVCSGEFVEFGLPVS